MRIYCGQNDLMAQTVLDSHADLRPQKVKINVQWQTINHGNSISFKIKMVLYHNI